MTAPFNAEDKVKVPALLSLPPRQALPLSWKKDAVKAASAAARVVGMLPANNLVARVFDFEAPAAVLNLVKYDARALPRLLPMQAA